MRSTTARRLGAAGCLLLLPALAWPWQARKSLSLPPAPAPSASATYATPVSDAALKVYGSCSFPDGLQVTDVQSMPADVRERPVISHGASKTVPLLGGRRITFAYPGAASYASVKAELLPAENWAANRALLLQDFADIIASDPNVARNTTRPAKTSGFSVSGLDRRVLNSNTLGIYLLLDDVAHIAATIYLLNPPQSKFREPADYARARDTFLYNYTRCVRNNEIGKDFGVTR